MQGPPATFGLLMSRYQHQYGLAPEALGKIAITQRAHALANPNALDKFKKPLTMDEYMASRMIADPLRVLDCVMFCDGANAFLVMGEDEARSRGLNKMARPKAYAEVTNFAGNESCPDITQSGFWKIAPNLYRTSERNIFLSGGTGIYEDVSGRLAIQVDFDFTTGEGSGRYRGRICTGRRPGRRASWRPCSRR